MGLRIYDIHLSFGEEPHLCERNLISKFLTRMLNRGPCLDTVARDVWTIGLDPLCFALFHGIIMTLSTMEVWTGSDSLVREWSVCDLEDRERTFYVLLILNSHWESLSDSLLLFEFSSQSPNSRHRHKAIKATPPSVIAMWVSPLNIVGDNPFVYSSLLCTFITFLHFMMSMKKGRQSPNDTNKWWERWGGILPSRWHTSLSFGARQHHSKFHVPSDCISRCKDQWGIEN